MRGAARCDLFFVRVDPYLSFRLSVQRLALSRAPQRQNSTRTVGRDGSSAVLYGPRMRCRQNEMLATTPAARTTPRAAPHRRNRDDPRTLTLAQRLDASPRDGPRPARRTEAGTDGAQPRTRARRRSNARRCRDDDADMSQRPQWSPQPDALVLRRCRTTIGIVKPAPQPRYARTLRSSSTPR